MSETDDTMAMLLQAKRNNETIYYGPKFDATIMAPTVTEPTKLVEADHMWNLNDNVYKIRTRREYIVQINDRDKNNPEIVYTDNHWTRSDFGKIESGEYILMREVYPEEMK